MIDKGLKAMPLYIFEKDGHEIIKNAFYKIIGEKITQDGYINMSKYIRKRISKEEYFNILSSDNSKFKFLFLKDENLPQKNTILQDWYQVFYNNKINLSQYSGNLRDLTYTEADAIVYWFYRSFKTIELREEFTISLLSKIYEIPEIMVTEEKNMYVYYDSKNITLKIIGSLKEYNDLISKMTINGHRFYRGHGNINYMLKPTIYRDKLWLKNERNIYEEIQVECPEEFQSYCYHLDKLVKMQHYDVPTRLLDITRNSLVALYFSCLDSNEEYGEVIVFYTGKYGVKYPQSDTVSVLASLSALSYSEKENLEKLVRIEKDKGISLNKKDEISRIEVFNKEISVLVQEIRQEKPAFLSRISYTDLDRAFIVSSLKNNKRIVKQDGAFIICGLDIKSNGLSSINKSMNEFRYKDDDGKRTVIVIKNKQEILNNLHSASINHAFLFPEIDQVAKYIRNKWSSQFWSR